MPIPDTLPDQLVPPSARDLDSSVDMLKDLLKNESRPRSPSSFDVPVSRLKNRSFTTDSPSFESGRDATIYKHTDQEPLGGIYKPRNRHLNRDDVKGRRDDNNPSADLDEMKRQLANTAKRLDDQALADASRTAEDEVLDREMEDLRYRVGRVKEDLDYISRGPRTAAKDLDRRKLEREMLHLMHERIPEVERKMKARAEKQEMEKRQWARDRDRAHERFGRFESRGYDERPYSRGYDRDPRRDRSWDRDDDDKGRERERDRERERENEARRPQSPPPRARSPPAPLLAPAAPQSSRSPAPNLKNMSPAERQAYMKAEAQRRVQARMAALGVTSSASPTLDSGVEDRLQQEKKEAEEKARAAEKQAEERERLRRERLESEKATREGTLSPAARNAPPAPEMAPPAPTKRPPAPPPPRRAPAPPRATGAVPTPPAPPAPANAIVPAESEVDPEEEALRAREEAIKKRHAERAARLRQLEEEEEKARFEEKQYQARLQAMRNRQAPPPRASSPPAVVEETPVVPPIAPPPPVPVVTSPTAASDKSTTNPFSRLLQERNGGGGSGIAVSVGLNEGVSTNPWARSTVSSVPPPAKSPSFVPPQTSKSPAPPVVKTDYQTASSALDDDEGWGDINEKDSDDSSSEDEYTKSREKRADIAQQLFGRPASVSSPSSPPGVGGSGISSPAPLVPPAPPAPPAPVVSSVPSAPVTTGGDAPSGIGALLGDIRGGLKLKPTSTVDKSGPSVSGRVVGGTNPPPPPPIHDVTPQPIDESRTVPELMAPSRSKMDYRQSVDWFATRAADHTSVPRHDMLPSTAEIDEEEEEEEEEENRHAPLFDTAIQIDSTPVDSGSDLMTADIAKSIGEVSLPWGIMDD